jgi:cobalamin synthase
MSTPWRASVASPRFIPLWGALVGAAGGGVYWIGAQFWPTSIAVVLSMLATAFLSRRGGEESGAQSTASQPAVFIFLSVLVKYNVLMGLSAANLPYRLPANLALGVIMIAGIAASRALVVSVLASPARAASAPASLGDFGVALAVGFAPAALIGLPGLIGLVAAILARIAFVAYLRRSHRSAAAPELDQIQQLTEVCFYLGALAAWAYI